MGKQKIILLIFTIFCLAASSQNLVPNPSFEDYDTNYVPTQYPFFNRTFGALESWRSQWPVQNTPDLIFEDSYIMFEALDPMSLQSALDVYSNSGLGINYVSSPTNYAGFEYPRTGLRYAGIRMETPPVQVNIFGLLLISNNPYHEYLQVELTDTLEAGKSYEVAFFISLAENAVFQNNSFGALLSQESESNFGVTPITPDIEATDSIISTEGWTEIKGNYIAQGGERFITIGNLDLSTITDTFLLSSQFNAVYYYIDDVSVFENIVTDTTLCPNDSLILRANPNSIGHLWSDGSTDSVFVVTEAGTYWHRGDYDNIFHTDTFVVDYFEPLTLTTTSNTTICYAESIEITANHNFDNVQYNWSTGDTTSSITVSEAGQYTIAITNVCEKQDNVVIIDKIPKMEFELGNDTILCHNTNILLTPQINNGDYNWQDGSSELIYLANNSGQYWLSISNECETVSDTINIEILDELILNLGPDLEVCEFPITIDALNQRARYLWHDDSEDHFITINDSSIVWVNVSNECESLDDTLNVKHFCGCELHIPNAFTPNNDGRNDLFDVILDSQCQLKSYGLTIYNRWGEEIFSSDDIGVKWNGEYKNRLVQNGPYTYSIRYHILGEKRKRIFGEVLLIN